jgi:hypothetical protein
MVHKPKSVVAYPTWLSCGLFIFADGYFIVCKEGNNDKASPFPDHSEKVMYQTKVYEHVEFKHTAISPLIS